MTSRPDLTALLSEWGRGNSNALNELLPLVYAELRRIAAGQLRAERVGHTLQPTALVHEVYLRLVDQRQVDWRDRAHFFGAAAQVMRRILVDHARRRRASKRGDGLLTVSIDQANEAIAPDASSGSRTGSCARSPCRTRRRSRAHRGTSSVRWTHDRRDGLCAQGLSDNCQARMAHRQGVAHARTWSRGPAVNSEKWQRAKALFQAALEHAPEERAAFLAAAAENDEELRREVELLLRADAAGVSVLDRLPLADAVVVASGFNGVPAGDAGALHNPLHEILEAGHRIGPYEIDALAWRGRDGAGVSRAGSKLNRDVALKVLPASFAVDPDRLERFKREAQMLAALNHPNIAAIYGFEDASHEQALVLELVDGPTLAEVIARGRSGTGADAHHRASDCRGARSRARQRHHPSRPEASQHQDREQRLR